MPQMVRAPTLRARIPPALTPGIRVVTAMATTPAKARAAQTTTPRATRVAKAEKAEKVERTTLSLATTRGRKQARVPRAVAEEAPEEKDKDKVEKIGTVVVVEDANLGKTALGTAVEAGMVAAQVGMAATNGMVVAPARTAAKAALSSNVSRVPTEFLAVAPVGMAAKAAVRKT